GANMFLRESYEPGKWPHKMQIIDPDFTMKTDNEIPTDVGGPLCFGGDYMSKNTPLPEAEKGDYLVIMDTGANSLGLWSMHCSRAMPKVIGIHTDGTPFVLKERQKIGDIINFWR